MQQTAPAVMIPFVDLKAQYASLKSPMDAAIQRVLDSTAFILGKEVGAFEQAFAEYIGMTHCVGVCSGTDALEVALRAYGIGPGDEVITVPNTYIATCEAISAVGAAIRWVEVDPRTYNMDPVRLQAAITLRTRAVIPVHLYGQPADMDPILEIAKRHKLTVIEDVAQAHGAMYRGRKAGTFGDTACFSFYPGKNLGAYGDAGAVVTNDPAIADHVRLLVNHGMRMEAKYVHVMEGYCHRLDNLQAAVLGVKLPHLDAWNAARRRAAALYDTLLQPLQQVVRPHMMDDVEHVYHLYVVQVPNRDRVQTALAARGIGIGVHYPIPLHQQPAYARLGHRPEDFPISQAMGPRLLSLPMYPEITEAQIAYVVKNLALALGA